MKINFFSPLPNLRTDIANMSASVLLELGRIAEVRAWTPQAEWSDELGATYEVRRFNPAALPIRAFNWADINFFNIGNDATYHKDIFNVSRTLPGIQILHDVRLAHFLAAYAEGDAADRDYYVYEMAQAGLGEEARRFLAGELPFQAFYQRENMLEAILRPAIGGILHNAAVFESIADVNRIPLAYIPLCLAHPLGPPPVRASPETAADRIIRLIVFGFIGKNRCLPEILHALAGVPDKARYVLEIYGTLEEPEQIENLVRELGLQAQVRQHGFVADAVLQAALAGADLAINLRNPTMGEASGSQLRIWANELPALVSNVGWYATLPRDAVFHIEEGNEIAGIREHLAALRRNPERYWQAGRLGRSVLERDHRPEQYARALVEIANQVPAMFARKTATQLARRSASLLLEATQGAPLTGITREIATQIHALSCWGAEESASFLKKSSKKLF